MSNKKTTLFLAFLFLVGVGIIFTYRFFSPEITKIILVDGHSGLEISPASSNFLHDSEISILLKNSAIKNIHITFTDQPQTLYTQMFSDAEGVYTSHTTQTENGTIFFTIHFNSEILKKYNWSEKMIANEALNQLFIAIYSINGSTFEERDAKFKEYIESGNKPPFKIIYAN